VLTVASGFFFGTTLGALYVNIGATTGATIVFLATRYFFHDGAQRRWGGKMQALEGGFSRHAVRYLLAFRLIPIFPFFLVNIISGLTSIPLRTFIWTTAIGILPGSLIYAYAGQQIGRIASLRDVASPGVLAAFIGMGMLLLLPAVYPRKPKMQGGKQ